MKTEIKNAFVMIIIVIIVLGGIGYYFTSLDNPKTNTQSRTDQTQTTNNKNSNASFENTSTFPPIDELGNRKAPELVDISGYINTTPEDLQKTIKGKVVLYDFWTYSCINCLRTLPYLNAWNAKYADKGLVIVGVHSPEFEFEKDINNVKMAVQKHGITYPVVLDSDHQTWSAFGNQYWPREYITDYQGYIRHDHIGEGNYDETEKIIQSLLDERAQHLHLNMTASSESLVSIPEHQDAFGETPELYFGYNFVSGRDFLGNAEGFQDDQTVTYTLPSNLQQNYFYLDGQWQNLPDSMKLVSNNGKIVLPYYAKDVHIVATGPHTDIQIQLDGKPVSADNAGQDVQDSQAHIAENRLYNIISSKQAGSHTLTITGHPGFEIFTFTFG